MVGTWPSNEGLGGGGVAELELCAGSILGQGTKIPHASWPKKIEHKQFNKGLKKNGPHQKQSLKRIK